MAPSSPSIWWLRSSTFVVAALASASAVWWALQLRTSTAQLPAVPAFAAAQADPAALLAVLGAHENAGPAAPASVAIDLIGVVAGPAGKGYALLAVAGAPAKAFGVGATVAPGLVLQSLLPRGAALGPAGGSPTLRINLPTLVKP